MNAPIFDFIDVSNPGLYRDDAWREPFAAMRRDDPVHRHADSPYGPYWSVTRYADIMKVELDHATYSSASEMGGIQIADQPKGQELPNFIRMDPPRHTAQRKTVAPIVAPTNLANMEGLIRERTAAVLDGLPRNQPFLAALASDLKRACGSGGTVADGRVEIQGDQRERLRPLLAARGWTVKG